MCPLYKEHTVYKYCKLLAPAFKPLKLFWPNLHETCILGKIISEINNLKRFDNRNLLLIKTPPEYNLNKYNVNFPKTCFLRI